MLGTLDSFNVQIYNEASCITIFSESSGAFLFYRGGVWCPCLAYPKEIIDTITHKNNDCQVLFLFHDANTKAYYASVDNVRIYEPVINTIKKLLLWVA